MALKRRETYFLCAILNSLQDFSAWIKIITYILVGTSVEICRDAGLLKILYLFILYLVMTQVKLIKLNSDFLSVIKLQYLYSNDVGPFAKMF